MAVGVYQMNAYVLRGIRGVSQTPVIFVGSRTAEHSSGRNQS
jgi:hypothetical protein